MYVGICECMYVCRETAESARAQEERREALTAVWVQVHFQCSGIGKALGALREGAQAGNLRSTVFVLFWHWSGFSLPPTAVVHQVGLQIPLTSVPDATRLARKYILCRRKHRDTLAAAHLEPTLGEVAFSSMFLEDCSQVLNQAIRQWWVQSWVLFHRPGLSF